MDLIQAELTNVSCLVSQGHVNHALVHKVGERCHVCSLLATLLGTSAHKCGTRFANELSSLPQPTEPIEKHLHLCSHGTKSGGHTYHDTIVLWQLVVELVVDGHDVAWFCWGTHLLKDSLGQELLHLKQIHGDALAFQACLHLFGQAKHMPIGRIVNYGHARAVGFLGCSQDWRCDLCGLLWLSRGILCGACTATHDCKNSESVS
mmetsp:Transcript_6883/g.12165  ORF Transcript_6883/g.12165 Transcript_6883/m.12165 type:complete len:205 (+) Transcript_6883:925-1539(+)